MRESTRDANIRLLNERLKTFDVAMLTTINTRDGSLHSRPMMTSNADFDGTLWFFSKFSSAKVDEIRSGSQVNLSYTAPAAGRYISVSGAAYVVPDRMKMEELWDESFRAWFPQGIDEPDLVLLRVDVMGADVWDTEHKEIGASLNFTSGV